MKKTLVAVGLSCVVGLLAGCGSSSGEIAEGGKGEGGKGSSESDGNGGGGGGAAMPDEEAVSKVVAEFYKATSDADGATACSYMTKRAQDLLVGQAVIVNADTCEEAIKFVAADFEPEEREFVANVELKDFEIDGDKATVPDDALTSDSGTKPEDSNENPMLLIKDGSEWWIDDVG